MQLLSSPLAEILLHIRRILFKQKQRAELLANSNAHPSDVDRALEIVIKWKSWHDAIASAIESLAAKDKHDAV